MCVPMYLIFGESIDTNILCIKISSSTNNIESVCLSALLRRFFGRFWSHGFVFNSRLQSIHDFIVAVYSTNYAYDLFLVHSLSISVTSETSPALRIVHLHYLRDSRSSIYMNSQPFGRKISEGNFLCKQSYVWVAELGGPLERCWLRRVFSSKEVRKRNFKTFAYPSPQTLSYRYRRFPAKKKENAGKVISLESVP